MRRWQVVIALFLLVSLVLGCSTTAQPTRGLQLVAPWQDGEETQYDVLLKDGTSAGTATWIWHKTPTGWVQAYEVNLGSRIDKGETVLDAALLPVSTWRTVGEARYEATYSSSQVIITSTVSGAVTTKTLTRPANALDNDQTLQTQRAMPLASGMALAYVNVIPTTSAQAPLRVTVDGPVTISVPAGEFSAWHMTMDFGSGKHDGWYSVDAPKLLLRYVNQASGASFDLRAWRAKTGAILQGNAVPATVPAGDAAPAEVTMRMNWPYMLLGLLVQIPVMIGIALLVGWQLRKRFGVSWKIFLYGAVTFIASQLVHIPLNWLLGQIGGSQGGIAFWPLPVVALVYGATAGLSEQGANWLALRFVVRKLRSYAEGLQFGAGHGAVEAIVTGLLALITLLNIIVIYVTGADKLGLTADQMQQLTQAFDQVLKAPLYMPLLAAAERIFALSVQMLCTILVVKSLVLRKPLYWLAAFGFHTLVDAWAVYGSQAYGVEITEAGLAVFAAVAIWLLWRMREPAQQVLTF
ncbi:MAG: YhfC family glutamic-type intramembrane protease [Anaerolineae bacterium]